MAANFKKKISSPGLNFRKNHQISKDLLKSSKSYGQKPLGVTKDPLGLRRISSHGKNHSHILAANVRRQFSLLSPMQRVLAA